MSLTKATLLAKGKIEKPTLLGEFFGEKVYVRSPSELRRSRRATMMFDGKNELRTEWRQNSRLYDIIDSVCDEKGNYVFSDNDLPELQELDTFKIDELSAAIGEWVDSKGKND
jgi:hypothetical protein